jgi:cytochrome oxidase Cu insertion factor (SCO1/SenC/PrrC family)
MLPLEQVLDSADQVQLWQDLRVFTPDWQRIFHQIPQEDLTLLVDRRGRVRGFYRGVLKDQTDRLMEDTRTLIAEYANTPNRRRRRL